jgi:MOB kinase activator 1
MLVEFCTAESCPVMSAGPKYEYLWADGTNVKTPLKVSAAEYIEYLMTWVENQLNNDTIFPSTTGMTIFCEIIFNYFIITRSQFPEKFHTSY